MRLDSSSHKDRPSLPPLLLGGIVFWIVVAVSYVPFMSQDFFVLNMFFYGSIFLVVLLLIVLIRSEQSFFPLIALCVVAGILVSCSGAGRYLDNCEKAVSEEAHVYTFKIIEDPKITSYGSSYCAETTLLTGQAVRVRLYFNEEVNISYGETLTSKTKLKEASETLKESFQKNGIVATATIHEYEQLDPSFSAFNAIAQVRKYAISLFDDCSSDSDVMLKAVLTGECSQLYTSDLYQAVKVCGLAHLVAVSGAHLVIVSAFVAFLLNKTPLSKRKKVIIQVAILVAYLFFVGFPISCMRATVMSLLSCCAPLLMRRSSSLSSLGAVIIFFIGLDPTVALSVSFSLSLLATLGIVVFLPLLMASGRKWNIPEGIFSPVAMTLVATLLTFPISTSVFSQFSLVAPLANVIATPFLTAICTLGIVAFCVYPLPFVGPILFLILRAIGYLFTLIINMLAQIPFACIPVSVDLVIAYVVVFLVCALLWILWDRISFKRCLTVGFLVVVVLALLLIVKPASNEIVMLDVGQGDSIVIKSNNKVILVDTGNQSSKLLEGLARNGVYHLDAVLITHPDDDHCGALSSLKGIIGIDAILVANGIKGSTEENPKELMANARKIVHDEDIVELKVGDRVAVGEFYCDVLAPEQISEGGNDDSVCFLLSTSFKNANDEPFRALFTGDAEKEIEETLVDKYHLSDLNLYKVSHHGSKNALTSELAQTLSPEIALIGVGKNNSYGHPNGQIINWLEEENCHIFRTDINGEVVCKITPEAVEVTTMK